MYTTGYCAWMKCTTLSKLRYSNIKTTHSRLSCCICIRTYAKHFKKSLNGQLYSRVELKTFRSSLFKLLYQSLMHVSPVYSATGTRNLLVFASQLSFLPYKGFWNNTFSKIFRCCQLLRDRQLPVAPALSQTAANLFARSWCLPSFLFLPQGFHFIAFMVYFA